MKWRRKSKVPAKPTSAIKVVEAPSKPIVFASGDKVLVHGAGGDWTGQISARRLSGDRHSIHPKLDDTAVFVTSDDTGISMPVSIWQVTKLERR
jgi:hypothetical protein